MLDKGCCSVAHGAAQRAVEVRWVARTTLVAEEVGDGAKLAVVSSLALSTIEFLLNHMGDKLLSVNLGQLDLA